MTDGMAFLKEFGFPIAVCAWFMWRMEQRVDRLNDRISKLITINTVLVKAVDAEVKEKDTQS